MAYAAVKSPDRLLTDLVKKTAIVNVTTTGACPDRFGVTVWYSMPGVTRTPVLRLVACGGSVSDQDQFKKDMIALLPRLRRFARTLTRDMPDADDLVQDACMKALANRAQWDPAQPLDRWMFRITRNVWFSELRKRKVRTGEGQVDASEASELQVESRGEGTVFGNEIRAHVSALPSELSSALMLVCAEGYSYREAAEMLEIPVGTVMSRIHRARKMLAGALGSVEQVAP